MKTTVGRVSGERHQATGDGRPQLDQSGDPQMVTSTHRLWEWEDETHHLARVVARVVRWVVNPR